MPCAERLACLVALLILPYACGGPSPMTDPVARRAVTAAVDAVLDDFHAAAASADGARYFGHFAADGVFLGTDASERWHVEAFRAYAEPHFSQGRGWTYTARERSVAISDAGDVAWFDERLHSEKYGEVRGSGVLIRRDGGWRIAHYNLSFPIPNAIAGEIVDRIRAVGERLPH